MSYMAHAKRITEKHLHKSGLIYVEEDPPGIRRRKCGRGYSFLDENGKCIKDKDVRDRLLKVAVPPSYTDVWYCPKDNGHLQATGIDGNNKKQYFYHLKWEELRDAVKFNMMPLFGDNLPRFRRRILRQLNDPSSDHDYVLAAMARILDRTGMRVGNEKATKTNNTYGLTTLKEKHVAADDAHIDIDYTGKGRVDIHTELADSKLVDVIDYCSQLPGQKLFKYKDEAGNVLGIDSQEFNHFLKEMIGEDFTAKDFRTWRFSIFFLDQVLSCIDRGEPFVLKNLLENVSDKSGNTPSVLQQSYIHPTLVEHAKNDDLELFNKDFEKINGLLKTESHFIDILSRS